MTPTSTSAKGSGRQSLLIGVLRTPQGLASAGIFALIVLVVALAPLIARYDPGFIDSSNLMAPPSGDHWMGTDVLGRDIFSRLLYGGQTNLAGAGLALLVSLAIGVPSGLIAGYRGGKFDQIASWFANLLIAVPGIIVLLAVSAIVGPSVWVSMSVFGVLLAPSFFRLVRTSVMGVREELYVDAARVAGLSDTRIIGRHVLAVVRGPIIINSATVLGIGIAIQAGLEFLNLGDQTRPSWGGMLNQAFLSVYKYPQLLVGPVVAIALTTITLAILANTVRDVLEEGGPKARWKTEKEAPVTPALPTGPGGDDVLLSVDNLVVGYPSAQGEPKVVVNGVSLHVARGEILGLVGESGSGKTQTAFSILGLLPESGRVMGGVIRLDGVNLETLSVDDYRKLRGSRIAYIPQEPMSNLAPSFTIGTQLVDTIRQHLGLSKAEARKRAIALLDRVGIADPPRVMRSYSHEISGGMAQRVLIAGAVACDPELLIADEPTTALDVTVQAEVLDLLRDLQRERSMAVLIVTHNFGVVADLCDRVAVMQNGTIVEQAEVRALFADPQHPYTRMLLEASLEDAPTRTPLTDRSTQ